MVLPYRRSHSVSGLYALPYAWTVLPFGRSTVRTVFDLWILSGRYSMIGIFSFGQNADWIGKLACDNHLFLW